MAAAVARVDQGQRSRCWLLLLACQRLLWVGSVGESGEGPEPGHIKWPIPAAPKGGAAGPAAALQLLLLLLLLCYPVRCLPLLPLLLPLLLALPLLLPLLLLLLLLLLPLLPPLPPPVRLCRIRAAAHGCWAARGCSTAIEDRRRRTL